MAKGDKKAQEATKPRVTPEQRAEQVKAVIALMEEGSSEHAACIEVGIDRNTFRSAALKVGAANDYARACEALAQAQVAKLEAAIDEARNGVIDVQVARLEVDTRKWLASKMLPKRYGDRLELDGGIDVKTPDAKQVMTELGSVLAKLNSGAM